MVRQPRSEATRRMIIDAAVDVFDEFGYAATGLGDIIERVEVTKGGLYHHFDSKESLALAIIDEGVSALTTVFRRITESSPALEGTVQGVIAVADLASTDKLARTSVQLLHTFANFNETAAGYYRGWVAEMVSRFKRARDDGDLRSDVDPRAIGEFIVAALVGVQVLTASGSTGTDLVAGVIRGWEMVLPGIASEQSLPYFRAFLERQSRRHHPHSAATDG
jgi:AcrR family transcriptional regulator